MINVIYNEENVELESKNEVVNLIKKLAKEGAINNRMVVIESEASGTLEIGLGMGEESLLFFIPESEDEDIKISCNQTVDRAKSEELELVHPIEESFICTKSNLVTLDQALEVLEIFLNEGDIFTKVDWYVY